MGMTVGETIKEERIKQGLSQEELAKKAGYNDKTAISKLEHADNKITLKQVKRIAKALGIEPSYLMGWAGTSQLINYNIYDMVSPEAGDKAREDMFDKRFMTEYKSSIVSLTNEEIAIIKGYRTLLPDQKEMVKRMVDYSRHLEEIFNGKDIHKP